MSSDRAGLDLRQAWEIITENGTRIILDPVGEEADDWGSRWMRIPAISDDGRLNLWPTDGRWRRLLWVYPLEHCHGTEHWGGLEAEIGKRLCVHTGMSDWWDSTTVVAIRPLRRDELPDPLPWTLDDEAGDG